MSFNGNRGVSFRDSLILILIIFELMTVKEREETYSLIDEAVDNLKSKGVIVYGLQAFVVNEGKMTRFAFIDSENKKKETDFFLKELALACERDGNDFEDFCVKRGIDTENPNSDDFIINP